MRMVRLSRARVAELDKMHAHRDETHTTLADHAEAWWRDWWPGIPVPQRDTAAWLEMYEQWVNWAFSDLRKHRKGYA